MDALSIELSSAFPSGHAMAAATLACVITICAHHKPALPLLPVAVWMFAFALGVSRIYLGEHFYRTRWRGGLWAFGGHVRPAPRLRIFGSAACVV